MSAPLSDTQTSIDELFVAIDEEAGRLAEIYADADWSGQTWKQYCKTVDFEEKGNRWWNKTKVVPYQMMQFLEINKSRPCRDKHCYSWHPTMWIEWGYLRSDGKLFFWGARSGYMYSSPRTYLADASLEEVQAFLNYIRECQDATLTRVSI